MEESQNTFRPHCLSIDLEVGKEDNRIHNLAAVRGDTGESFVKGKLSLKNALLKRPKCYGNYRKIILTNFYSYPLSYGILFIYCLDFDNVAAVI